MLVVSRGRLKVPNPFHASVKLPAKFSNGKAVTVQSNEARSLQHTTGVNAISTNSYHAGFPAI